MDEFVEFGHHCQGTMVGTAVDCDAADTQAMHDVASGVHPEVAHHFRHVKHWFGGGAGFFWGSNIRSSNFITALSFFFFFSDRFCSTTVTSCIASSSVHLQFVMHGAGVGHSVVFEFGDLVGADVGAAVVGSGVAGGSGAGGVPS